MNHSTTFNIKTAALNQKLIVKNQPVNTRSLAHILYKAFYKIKIKKLLTGFKLQLSRAQTSIV